MEITDSTIASAYARLRPDQFAALDTGRNLALRAGAGSGKTTVLAHRYLWLLEGGVPPRSGGASIPLNPDQILTLTFTRKAAEEMRRRIAILVGRRLAGETDKAQRDRWRRMREQIDYAPITTIHAFCKSLLEEFSLVGELSPALDIADEDLERRLLNEAVVDTLDAAFEEQPERVRRLARFWTRPDVEATLAAMVQQMPRLHEVEAELGQFTVDALEQRAFSEAAEQLDRLNAAGASGGLVHRALEALRGLYDDDLRQRIGTGKRRPNVLNLLEGTEESPRGNENAEWEPYALAKHVRAVIVGITKSGGAELYDPESGRSINSFTGSFKELGDRKEPAIQWYRDYAAELLALGPDVEALPGEGDQHLWRALCDLWPLAEAADAAIREKLDRRALLRFDDVLAEAHRLLLEHPEVLAVLRGRFRQIMVDEFQDTNGRQWEIVRLLASEGDPRDKSSGAKNEDGGEVKLAHARLFLVGDDKQSIYRFQEADVAVFEGACAEIKRSGADDDPPVLPQGDQEIATNFAGMNIRKLDENFRTRPAVMNWINALFSELLGVARPSAEQDLEQPHYEARPQSLKPMREDGKMRRGGAIACLFPKETEDDAADQETPREKRRGPLKRGECVALAVANALGRNPNNPSSLLVFDEDREEERPANFGDVMVLFQARSGMLQVERRLHQLGIPYVVEKGIGFFDRQEIHDSLHLLSFLADTRDDLALFALLRSPFFSLTDQAIALLSEWPLDTQKDKAGSWWRRLQSIAEVIENRDGAPKQGMAEEAEWLKAFYPADLPGISEAARLLGEWLHLAPRLPVAQTIRLGWEQTGALATLNAQGRANLEKLIEMARNYERGGYSSMRGFLTEIREAAEEGGRREGMAEIPLKEEAVRLMTVHAAKGLEAPIVVLADMHHGAKGNTGGPAKNHLMQMTEFAPALGRDRTIVALTPPAPLKKALEASGLESVEAKRLKAETDLREAAEKRRLFYVAATRARDHLIMVLQTNKASDNPKAWEDHLKGLIEQQALGEGADKDAREQFWEDSREACAWTAKPDGGSLSEIFKTKLWDAKKLRESIERKRLEFVEENDEIDRDLRDETMWRAGGGGPVAPENITDTDRQSRALYTLSASQAGLLAQSPEAFFRAHFLAEPRQPNPSVRKPVRRLRAEEFGSLVHRAFLEGIDSYDDAREITYREAAGFGLFTADPKAQEELERCAKELWEALERWERSETAARLAEAMNEQGAQHRRELPIRMREGNLIVAGTIDWILWGEEKDARGWAEIVDFKTDAGGAKSTFQGSYLIPGAPADANHEIYRTQLELYAHAWLKAHPQTTIRCTLYYTATGEPISWDFDHKKQRELSDQLNVWNSHFSENFQSVRDAIGTTGAKQD